MTPGRIDVDVVVVGGGPAGLATAHTVASAGHETLVVERQQSIGERVRTSGMTAGRTPKRLGCPGALWHELRSLRFSTLEDDVVLDCDLRPFGVFDVRGFYRWLGDRAESSGAEVLTGAAVTGLRRSGEAVTGCFVEAGEQRLEIAARVVVDASGYRATVSKLAGLHAGFSRFGVGAEYELAAPAAAQDEAVIVLSEGFAPCGYGWLFPWGGDRVRLGVGVHHPDVRANPRDELRRLRASAEEFRLDLTSASVREHHFGLVPADGRPKRAAADGIVAVGDAAGHATLVAGEGIRIAIQAGELAGETIVAALQRGRTTGDELRAYERRFHGEFARDLRVGEMINRRLSRFGDAEWNASLALLRRLPADLVLDILESRFSRRRLLGWLATHPRAALRSRTLGRAALGL